MINYTVAWKMRKRGTLFYTEVHTYVDDRLKYIAFRQKELIEEMDLLDREIKSRANKEILEKESTTPLDTVSPTC